MKNNSIDGSNSKHDCGCGFTVNDTTQSSENGNGPTDRHAKTMCKCCYQKGADEMPLVPFFVVVATNTVNWLFEDWVVAVYQSELDANDHCEAAQAVADKLSEDYRNGLLEDVDWGDLENEFDPRFRFEPDGIDYVVEPHSLFKFGPQGIKEVKKWADEYEIKWKRIARLSTRFNRARLSQHDITPKNCD